MSKLRQETFRRCRLGFTMLELLVSTVVLITIITLLARALTQTETIWDRGQSRMRLLSSGRAALNVIRDDLESAFSTNVFMLVDGENNGFADFDLPIITSAQSGFKIEPSFGFENTGLFFYRFSATPRKGFYPVEAISYSLTNNVARDSLGREYELPVLFRNGSRFKVISEEPQDEDIQDEAWEDDAAPDAPDELDDINDLPDETRLPLADSTLSSSVRLLEGVAAFYCIPRSISSDTVSEDKSATHIDYVDIYLELLTPSQCRRAFDLNDEKQKEFVEKNALRLSARFAIGAHPAFNIPDSIVTPWESQP